MFKNKYFWLAICWTILVTFLSLVDSNYVPSVKIPNADKVVHFIFYFFFTIIWYLSFKGNNKGKHKNKILLISCMTSVIYGIVMEIFQTLFTMSRSADVKDVVANIIGSIAAVILYKYKNLNKE